MPRDACNIRGFGNHFLRNGYMTKRTCCTPDCNKPHSARGWCAVHYQRAYQSGQLESQPRKHARPTDSLDARLRNIGWTVTASGCWEWNGHRDSSDYGMLSVNRGRPHKASRIAYEAWVAVPNENVDICHTCDNPPCINPAHLFEGTRLENMADMVSKGRSATWSKRPHKLTASQVMAIREAYATGGVYQKDLADAYGVTQPLISGIVNQKIRTAA